jgi:hypothetical protein
MRSFMFLAGILIAAGVVIAVCFVETFSLGSSIGGLARFVFAWIGRSIATGEAGTPGPRHQTPKLTRHPASGTWAETGEPAPGTGSLA